MDLVDGLQDVLTDLDDVGSVVVVEEEADVEAVHSYWT